MGSGKGGGDLNVALMFTILTVNFIMMFFWLAIYGINTPVATLFFGIPNTPFGIPIAFTFISLVIVFVGLMATLIGLLFILQMATGASFLGSGAGRVGGTIVLMVSQYVPMILVYFFTAIFATSLMNMIPYGFGIVLQVIFGILYLIGLVLHQRAAGD